MPCGPNGAWGQDGTAATADSYFDCDGVYHSANTYSGGKRKALRKTKRNRRRTNRRRNTRRRS